MLKNIVININIEPVGQSQEFLFFALIWSPGGTKVAQNGISSPGIVWKSCMVFWDTPLTTSPYRNLCIFGVSIISDFDQDLPVL